MKAVWLKATAAPWTLFHRDRGRVFSGVVSILGKLGVSRVIFTRVVVSSLAHTVRRRRGTNPESDFKWPFPERLVVRPLEFQSTH